MRNNYEMPEINEIGRAQDVILGSAKGDFLVDDGVDQPKRQTPASDDDE